jgi:hypothetical protein
MKKIIIFLLAIAFLSGCSKSVLSSDFDSLQTEYNILQSRYDELEKEFSDFKIKHDEASANLPQTTEEDKPDELFADLIMQGIRLNYAFDGTMLYDGVAQINVMSEKSPDEEFKYLNELLKENSINLASIMKTYKIGILYFKVVTDKGYPMFEYTYTFGVDESEVKVSVATDYIDIIN